MITPKRIQKLINHAKRISDYSEYKFKLGAVIFKGNRIISTGFNKNKTHPKFNRYFKHATVHAEIDAILHSSENLVGTSMMVCRTTNTDRPAMAKPCAMCVQVMYEFGIKEVFWTTSKFPFWDSDLIENLYDKIDKSEAYKQNSY